MANSRLYLVHKESNTGVYLMVNSGGLWFPAANDFKHWENSIMEWADMSGINYDNNPTLHLVFEEDLPQDITIVSVKTTEQIKP